MSQSAYNRHLMENLKKLETSLKRKADRLNRKEVLTPSESIILDETIQTLQYMQDIGLIVTWRWDL
jgi:hypothetical protein